MCFSQQLLWFDSKTILKNAKKGYSALSVRGQFHSYVTLLHNENPDQMLRKFPLQFFAYLRKTDLRGKTVGKLLALIPYQREDFSSEVQ